MITLSKILIIKDVEVYNQIKEFEKQLGHEKDYAIFGQMAMNLTTHNLEFEFTILNKEECLKAKKILLSSKNKNVN